MILYILYIYIKSMRNFIFIAFLIDSILSNHYFRIRFPPSPSPPPPNIIPPPMTPFPNTPPFPPGIPLNACKKFIPNLCDVLREPNYFDVNCYSNDDPYGGLGCNAGGLICCRFCEFSQYSNVPCILSPSLPPSPFLPPAPPPSTPPKNPLIISIGEPIRDPDKAKVNFHMRINSNIESINKFDIENKLFNIFNRVPPKYIQINFRPGSLIIDVSILTNSTLIQNTSNVIDTLTTVELSEVLNVSVIELTPPLVENYISSQEIINNKRLYNTLIGAILIFCINLFCLYRCIKKCNNKENNKIEFKKKNFNKDAEFKVDRLSGVLACKQTELFNDRDSAIIC